MKTSLHLSRSAAILCCGLILSGGVARGVETFVFLNSQPGDSIGQGMTRTFRPVDGLLSASRNFDNGVSLLFSSDTFSTWNFDFAAPGDVPLTPGTYTGATRFPFQSASNPGLNVSGAGRGSNTLIGQFTVTDIAYGAGNAVERFVANFEQHSEGRPPALFGQVSFDLATARPTPAQLREATRIAPPDLAELLAFSNRLTNVPTGIYLFSEPGDFIGQGREQQLTPGMGTFSASGQANGVQVSFSNASTSWSFDFDAPNDLPFIAGEYGGATRFPFNSPTKPGLSVSGAGRGSNTLTGNFLVLESAISSTGAVERLDVLFEQHSEGGVPALFGRVRLNATVIPEPASCLFGVAMCGVVFIRRFRAKSRRDTKLGEDSQ